MSGLRGFVKLQAGGVGQQRQEGMEFQGITQGRRGHDQQAQVALAGQRDLLTELNSQALRLDFRPGIQQGFQRLWR